MWWARSLWWAAISCMSLSDMCSAQFKQLETSLQDRIIIHPGCLVHRQDEG